MYANVQASLAQEGGQFCSCRHAIRPAGRSAGTYKCSPAAGGGTMEDADAAYGS